MLLDCFLNVVPGMFPDCAALRERGAQREEKRLHAVERKVQLLEKGGGREGTRSALTA
jgi:hypothetical protein